MSYSIFTSSVRRAVVKYYVDGSPASPRLLFSPTK